MQKEDCFLNATQILALTNKNHSDSSAGRATAQGHKRIQDDITEIRVLVDLVRTSRISLNVRGWLNAPDATIDHNAACAKKPPGTGI